MVERLAVAALPSMRSGKTVVSAALPDEVAELPVKLQGAMQVAAGVGVGTKQFAGAAENTVGTGLLGQVAEALGRGQRDGMGGRVVVPVP